MSVSDASIAGILEIPPTALRAIKDAEAGLIRIHDASRKAAGQVYNDFSKRMPIGIDVFIRKLAEAKQAMDKVGTVNVTLTQMPLFRPPRNSHRQCKRRKLMFQRLHNRWHLCGTSSCWG